MAISLVAPPPLRAGQRIGMVSVAGRVNPARVESALRTLADWGLTVVMGQHAFAQHHTFAGTDAQRAADLQAMLDDPSVAAIISTRGGYGTSRLVDALDFTSFLRRPKWLIGLSDLTVLHSHLHRLGVQSLHAAMPVTFAYPGAEPSVASLRALLFGERMDYTVAAHPLNRPGSASGQLTGGNLSLLAHLLGTASEADTAGKILFIEDIGEQLYHLDRLLVQLRRAGKLTNLAGLLVGQFTDLKDGDPPFGATAYEIVAQQVSGYGYPVAFGFPVGHEALNLALPCGRVATLLVAQEGTRLIEQPTAGV